MTQCKGPHEDGLCWATPPCTPKKAGGPAAIYQDAIDEGFKPENIFIKGHWEPNLVRFENFDVDPSRPVKRFTVGGSVSFDKIKRFWARLFRKGTPNG